LSYKNGTIDLLEMSTFSGATDMATSGMVSSKSLKIFADLLELVNFNGNEQVYAEFGTTATTATRYS